MGRLILVGMQPRAPANEPVFAYAPGSSERDAVLEQIESQSKWVISLPLVIGGQSVETARTAAVKAPHRHSLQLGQAAQAEPSHVRQAIEAALAARGSWSRLELGERAAIFQRAAALLAGPWRMRLNAATMLGQSKTVHQAEIDAACELINFFRFNAWFAERMSAEQPLSTLTETNRSELRPLEGFVVAVTPFNFTSIAGNLPTAPALMGNTVVWKPSPHAMLSAHYILRLLEEAGLPPGVINLVYGDAQLITRELLSHPDFAGLHFTGSTSVFRGLFRTIASGLDRYRSYPRIVGETGGKDFIVAHPSADTDALAVAILRGGYEYQGQKCSAVSRVYVPRSCWTAVRERLLEQLSAVRVGDPTDFRSFMGAVIGRHAFERIRGYQEAARADAGCEVLFGGGGDDEQGYFIEPTLVRVDDPRHRLMQEEIFGPVVAAYVYEDDRFEQVLDLCDSTSGYALTGAVFARDRSALALARSRLRDAAGNFYLNDKPTGAVVGQQPFGGGRLSGTNDKAGSSLNLWRWVSPRTIKENLCPPHEWRYPYLQG